MPVLEIAARLGGHRGTIRRHLPVFPAPPPPRAADGAVRMAQQFHGGGMIDQRHPQHLQPPAQGAHVVRPAHGPVAGLAVLIAGKVVDIAERGQVLPCRFDDALQPFRVVQPACPRPAARDGLGLGSGCTHQ
nr:hypothetical protein [Haematobacter massiliensis]